MALLVGHTGLRELSLDIGIYISHDRLYDICENAEEEIMPAGLCPLSAPSNFQRILQMLRPLKQIRASKEIRLNVMVVKNHPPPTMSWHYRVLEWKEAELKEAWPDLLEIFEELRFDLEVYCPKVTVSVVGKKDSVGYTLEKLALGI